MANAVLSQEGFRVLFKGFDVVESHDNALWTVHPDGTETFIKEMPAPFCIEGGSVFHISP